MAERGKGVERTAPLPPAGQPIDELAATMPVPSSDHGQESEPSNLRTNRTTVAAGGLGASQKTDASGTYLEGWPGSPDGRVDHFEVTRRIGHGGMGAVFLARDLSLDRLVGLKILPRESAKNDQAEERFIREARAQARVSSPHVTQIFFIGRMPAHGAAPPASSKKTPRRIATTPADAPGKGALDATPGAPGLLYFAMEYVDNESLEAIVDRGEKLAPEEARRMMREVVRGLLDAQSAGVIHRDIKPGNLLLTKQRHVKIADFGLAKPIDAKAMLTRAGAVMGTPLYMAPEQAMGEPVDHRADMYALGCSFYHLVTGQPPIDGPSGPAILIRHQKEKPVPIQEREPSVSQKFAAIIERLMAKKAAERYATYEDLLTALDAAAPERVVYAGFWPRGAALAIDCVILSVLIALLGWPGLVLHLIYVTTATGAVGQTLGKMLLKMRVCRMDGQPLGFARSAARTMASMWMPFLLGTVIFSTQGADSLKEAIDQLAKLDSARSFLVPFFVANAAVTLLYFTGICYAAIDRMKRAAHDLLVGSIVVYRFESTGSAAKAFKSLQRIVPAGARRDGRRDSEE